MGLSGKVEFMNAELSDHCCHSTGIVGLAVGRVYREKSSKKGIGSDAP
jgi:hypothetical protein